jgi:hypothetical protein
LTGDELWEKALRWSPSAQWPLVLMKRNFGAQSAEEADVAIVNETLCKILCHNLVVLIHEMCGLGIDPVFWPQTTA